MIDDQHQESESIEAIEMIDAHTGDEIALGISAHMHAVPGAGDKGSPAADGKAMGATGMPQASAAPPPQPSDAATSAKPASRGKS
jgi:hypothetical protein